MIDKRGGDAAEKGSGTMNVMTEQKAIELASHFQRELGRIDKPEGTRRVGQEIIDQFLHARSKTTLRSEGEFDWLRPYWCVRFPMRSDVLPGVWMIHVYDNGDVREFSR